MVEPEAFDVLIFKYDSQDEDHPLEDAEFVLSRTVDQEGTNITEYAVFTNGVLSSWADNLEEATTLASDQDGFISLGGLEAGDYTLTETKAPDGYVLLESAINFNISSGGDIILKTDNENVSISEDDGKMMIANVAGRELPQTGGPGMLPFAMTGSVLFGGATLVFFRRKRFA